MAERLHFRNVTPEDSALPLSALNLDLAAVGSILKSARTRLKLPLSAVAHASGIVASHIWAIENGTKEVSVEKLMRLAAFYGFAPGLLLEAGIKVSPLVFRSGVLKELDNPPDGAALPAEQRELFIEFVSGSAAALTYLLRSTRPGFLVQILEFPSIQIKRRFVAASARLEYLLAPSERMLLSIALVSTPLSALHQQSIYSDSDARYYAMLRGSESIPIWDPSPKRFLSDIHRAFALPPITVEERGLINKSKLSVDEKKRASKR